MTWQLRYASHLGYHDPLRGLFAGVAGSDDPVAQIEVAASLGLAGVQYARAVEHSPAERARVRAALERHRLEAGTMTYGRRDVVLAPLWADTSGETRAARERALDEAFAAAGEIGARYIIVFSQADHRVPLEIQHAAFVENLKRAAPLAERHGVVLCLENMSRTRRAGTLVSHVGQAYALAKAVDSPAVRIVFDTGHVQVMDGNILDNLRAVWDAVAVVQIADNPGRLEPGSGELNVENILREVQRLGYAGLVELEHDWSACTREAEERGVAYLRALDARLASRPH